MGSRVTNLFGIDSVFDPQVGQVKEVLGVIKCEAERSRLVACFEFHSSLCVRFIENNDYLRDRVLAHVSKDLRRSLLVRTSRRDAPRIQISGRNIECRGRVPK